MARSAGRPVTTGGVSQLLVPAGPERLRRRGQLRLGAVQPGLDRLPRDGLCHPAQLPGGVARQRLRQRRAAHIGERRHCAREGRPLRRPDPGSEQRLFQSSTERLPGFRLQLSRHAVQPIAGRLPAHHSQIQLRRPPGVVADEPRPGLGARTVHQLPRLRRAGEDGPARLLAAPPEPRAGGLQRHRAPERGQATTATDGGHLPQPLRRRGDGPPGRAPGQHVDRRRQCGRRPTGGTAGGGADSGSQGPGGGRRLGRRQSPGRQRQRNRGDRQYRKRQWLVGCGGVGLERCGGNPDGTFRR